MDELNSPVEQVVEPSNVLSIDDFFDDMYLTESEKEERKELAKNIFIILSAILTIIKANEVLKNSHDTQEYKGYVADNLKSLFRVVFGSDKYNSQIDSFADEFIDSTMRNIDNPYFTSDDRATVNAEQQSNAIYNQQQYEQAVQSGKTTKKWVTMHDKRVRKTHDEADGQEVDINKPFEVGSSELMFPCDLSLGASLKEICNCRCVVVYSGNKNEDTEDSLKGSENSVTMKSPLIPMNLQFFAIIPEEKFTDYALDFTKDKDKATAFKLALGYTKENYRELIDKINEQVDINKCKYKGTNEYGKLYEQVMSIEGANGKNANVCTGWILKDGDSDITLTSAYVTKKGVTKV